MRFGLSGAVDCAHSLLGHGLCESLHGHTYRVEAVIERPAGAARPLDWAKAQAGLEAALKPFDHVNLNERMDFASCENFCRLLFDEIKAREPGLIRLKVWEGEGKWAECGAL